MFSECPFVDYMQGAEPPSFSLEWHQAVLFICVLLPLLPFRDNGTQTLGKEEFTQGQVEPISRKAKARTHWGHVMLELWPGCMWAGSS